MIFCIHPSKAYITCCACSASVQLKYNIAWSPYSLLRETTKNDSTHPTTNSRLNTNKKETPDLIKKKSPTLKPEQAEPHP